MKKDILLKRLFCAVCVLLSVFALWNDLRDLFTGQGADSGILLSLIGLIAAGYLFLHPEKLKWGDLGKAWRIYLGVFLSMASGLICVLYLYLGLKMSYLENWRLICMVNGVIAVIGFFILFPEKLRKGRDKREEQNNKN